MWASFLRSGEIFSLEFFLLPFLLFAKRSVKEAYVLTLHPLPISRHFIARTVDLRSNFHRVESKLFRLYFTRFLVNRPDTGSSPAYPIIKRLISVNYGGSCPFIGPIRLAVRVGKRRSQLFSLGGGLSTGDRIPGFGVTEPAARSRLRYGCRVLPALAHTNQRDPI